MNPTRTLAALALATLCGASSATASDAPAPKPAAALAAGVATVTPNRLLVRLPGFDDVSALSEAVARLGHDVGAPLELERPSILDWAIVRVAGEHDAGRAELEQLAEVLRAQPFVAGVSLDRTMSAFATFNDPGIPQQHGLDSVDLPRAWDVTTGNPNLVVAVVDSGIVPHEDLDGVVLSGYDFVSDGANGGDGDGRDSNPYDDGGDQFDCGGQAGTSGFHGTMVSGVLAARQNNGRGVAGAAEVGLTAVRALGACGGTSVDIAEATWWAAGGAVDGVPANPNPAQVVNLSLGGPGQCDSYTQSVFDGLDDAGIIAVVAAGNSAEDTAGTTPANCDKVITVAATDHEDYLSSFSNYGGEVDVLAPGGDITYYQQDEAGILTTVGPGSDDYTFTQGTSFSAPFVSGVVALMLSVEPTLGRAAIEQTLRSTGGVAWCPAGGEYVACDRELVDAGAAVAAVAGGDVDPGNGGDDGSNNGGLPGDDAGDDEGADERDDEVEDDELAAVCADPAFAFYDECLDYGDEYYGPGCSLEGTDDGSAALALLAMVLGVVGVRRLRA